MQKGSLFLPRYVLFLQFMYSYTHQKQKGEKSYMFCQVLLLFLFLESTDYSGHHKFSY